MLTRYLFWPGPCNAGYYCTGGAYIPEPNDNQTTGAICPQHYVCPPGSSAAVLCTIGYMANNTGLSVCQLCIDRFYCLPGEAPRECPEGERVFYTQWKFGSKMSLWDLLGLVSTYRNITGEKWGYNNHGIFVGMATNLIKFLWLPRVVIPRLT